MFIKNNEKHDIPNDGMGITEGGFSFIIPGGKVCAIWDQAGKLITEKLFKIHDSKTGGIDPRTQKPDSAMFPAITVAEKEDWDGKTYAIVQRVKILENVLKISNGSIDNLMKLAEERGVSEEKLRQFRHGEETTPEDIAQAIDELPIPDDVRYPEQDKETAVKKDEEPEENKENESDEESEQTPPNN